MRFVAEIESVSSVGFRTAPSRPTKAGESDTRSGDSIGRATLDRAHVSALLAAKVQSPVSKVQAATSSQSREFSTRRLNCAHFRSTSARRSFGLSGFAASRRNSTRQAAPLGARRARATSLFAFRSSFVFGFVFGFAVCSLRFGSTLGLLAVKAKS